MYALVQYLESELVWFVIVDDNSYYEVTECMDTLISQDETVITLTSYGYLSEQVKSYYLKGVYSP